MMDTYFTKKNAMQILEIVKSFKIKVNARFVWINLQ